MRPYGLLPRTLLILTGLFGVTILAVAAFLIWSINQTLTAEFRRNGKDIAESIANSSVDLLLNQDPTAIQSMIDERREGIPGISYILVMDDQGDVISHTFVAAVPDEVRQLPGDPHNTAFHVVRVDGLGDSIDVCSAILSGQGGYVHVGMDRKPIQEMIWRRIRQIGGLLLLLFLVSALTTFALMRKVTLSLRRLTASAQRLASGDASATGERASLPDWFPVDTGKNEVAQLTRAFRSMAYEVTARETGLKEQFKRLLDSTAEGIYGVDVEDVCIFCNPACAHLVGYQSPKDLLGHKMHNLVHHTRPDGSPYPVSECHIQQAFREGKGTHVDDEVLWRADGSSFPVEYWANPMYREGEPIGTVVTFVDISERKRIEASLRLSMAAMEAAANGIAITDIDGDLEWINPAFTTLTGYSAAEVIGQNTRVLKSGKQAPEFYEQMWKAITAGEVWHGELVNKRKDGSLYNEEMTITPVRAGTGPISQFVAIKQDITKRKQAEEAMCNSESRLRRITDNMLDLICQLDVNGIYQYVSPSYEPILGYAPEGLPGQSAISLIHPEDRARALVNIEAAVRTRRVRDITLRFRHKDGHYIWLESIGKTLVDSNDQVLGLVVASRDISKRVQAEDALHQAKEAAEQSYRFAHLTLDALSTHIAILDEKGVIIAVNKAWREFAIANAAKTEVGVGASYLDVCDGAVGPYGEEAAAVAAGIRAVIRREQADFALEYPCHSPSEKRWFLARATQFGGDGPVRVVMSHDNITAAKLADEERQQFVSLVENSIDFVGMASLSGEVIYTNPAACQLVGLDPALRRTASKITDYFTDAGKRALGDVVLPAVMTTGRWEGEMQFRNFRTGRPIEMNSSVFIVRHPKSGDPLCMATVSRDVTERKRAEEALRLNVAAMEAAANGIAIADINGMLEWVNPAFAKLTHCSAAELIGQKPSILMSGSQVPEFYEQRWEIITSGKVWHGELLNKRKDGTLYDEEMTITPVRDTTGDVTHYVVIKQDITKRKQTEEALRASESQFRFMVEGVRDYAVIMLDCTGSIQTWNIGAEQVFGFKPEDIIGQPLRRFFPPKDIKQNTQEHEIQKALALGKAGGEDWRIRKDGTQFWANFATAPIYNSHGELQGFSNITKDLTERKQAEIELHQAKGRAESANRAKSEFLAHMSHEIRTPMNGILGMTELVMDTALSPEQREYLALVKLSADSLLKIINDILDFSKIEAGKMSLDLADFRIRETVGKVMKILALRAHEKNLELALRVAPDVPDVVIGDADRLRQIIINLVGNAIKFTERGEVVVGVQLESRTTNEIELHGSVADTGIGIPRDKHGKLFQAFQQVDASDTRRHGGTGLGLVIAQRLVQMMGGRIWFESEPGQGTTFHFIIKMGIGHQAAPASAPLGIDELTDLPVLIVDDNATNRQILHEMLHHWHMRPTSVDGATAALRALDDALQFGQSFRLMLVDARMPEIDGFALVEKIRQRPELEGAVIMMLTSTDQPEDRARCHQLGIDTYLVKPVQQEELREAILIALGKKATSVESTGTDTQKKNLQPSPRALHILLAEDQPVNQRLAVRMLEKRGHSVVVANNGREALEVLAREAFDLMLMDVQMPEMDGFETTRSIRLQEESSGRHLPIIAMTAYAIKEDRERCLAAGCDDYLAKPIDSSSLYEVVERWAGLVANTPGQHNRGALNAAKDDQASEAWNRAAALARVDGDEVFLRELAELFMENCPTLLAQLETAIQQRDEGAIAKAAHTLQGNVASLGATAAYGQSRLLEEKAKAGELDDIEQHLAEMQRRLDLLLEILKSFLAETGSN